MKPKEKRFILKTKKQIKNELLKVLQMEEEWLENDGELDAVIDGVADIGYSFLIYLWKKENHIKGDIVI